MVAIRKTIEGNVGILCSDTEKNDNRRAVGLFI